MTESEWDCQRDPLALLEHLFPMRGLDSTEQQTRESKLYLLGCARLAWDRLPWVGRKLLEIAERLVDHESIQAAIRSAARELAEELTNCRGEAEDLAAIERRLLDLDDSLGRRFELEPKIEPDAWATLAHLIYYPFAGTTPHYRRIAKEDHCIELLRDVFPNPFRDAQIRPEWRDRTVTGIARGMYASRDFSPLPLLADALQDAGCANDHVLDHCRSPGPHIRGCWVVEGILRKKNPK